MTLRSKSVAAIVAAALMAAGHAFGGPVAVAADNVAVPAEAAALSGEHPAEYYRSAAHLFGDGKQDDAVFLFYLGQLRYRVHLAARRGELRPDGDPALFTSLSEVVGRPINEYAFGDLAMLGRIIDAVLAYDLAHPDPFTPAARYPGLAENIRQGLGAMKAQILQQADKIRADRARNGLPNRN